MAWDEKDVEKLIESVIGCAVGKTVEQLTTLVTGTPGLGKAAGRVAGTLFSSLPDEVKGGAMLGTFAAVSCASKIVVAGGALAMGLAAAPWLIGGGILFGVGAWAFGNGGDAKS